MAIEVVSVRNPRRLPRLKGAASRVRESAARARERAGILRILCVTFLFSSAAIFLTLGYFYHSYSKVVDGRLASGYLTSRAGIYAAPRVLRVGQSISREQLVEILRRAGYVEGDASNVWSGRFVADSTGVEITPRRADQESEHLPETVRIEFDKRDRVRAITGDGATLASFTLEPEPLTNDAGMKTGRRAALAYGDIPPALVRAVLAIEDRRFFDHSGLDAFGIARAALVWSGARDDNRVQGGSTITQQLVKNTYLTPERTLRRKFNEAVIASVIERRLSKEDIFALYCNEIYLGQRGSVGVRGVGQATRIYFGKELKDLSLAEAATIAGMIQSPAHFAPDRHPERARARRNTVIDAMLRDGAITAEDAAAASREPVAVVPADHTANATAPYFIDYVNRAIESRFGTAGEDTAVERQAVYTTLDMELQQLAEASVSRQLEKLKKIYKGQRKPQAALVALNPRNGHVLAMVGGENYAESQLNRATDARRQPGSVFKPFVYAAALESGLSPVSTYTDAPRVFQYDRRATYKPANYGNGYSMRDVTMRTALIRSLNVVTVDVAMRTGLARVASLTEKFGLPKPEAYPSLALGTTEATPLEIAVAYTALANGGQIVKPTVIARASDDSILDSGNEHVAVTRQVVRPSTAYMLTDMLTGVIKGGTARAANGAIKNTAIAGKTGTSRDGWFVGYTPNLVCVVWVGFDDNEELGLTGAESALPAWLEFVKGAVDLRPELGGEQFERPAGINFVETDPETGMLASPACPQRERVAVTGGLAPNIECHTHAAPQMIASLDEQFSDGSVTAEASVDEGAYSSATYTNADTRLSQAPSLPRVEASVEAVQVPSRTRTQVEKNENGRSRLTNEVRVAIPSDGANR